jgi:hypothetical protein
MRKNEESLRRLKRGKKTTFSLFASSASSAASSDENMDEDRVRIQIILDVDALGKDAEAIGIDVNNSEGFQVLKILAEAKYDDGN